MHPNTWGESDIPRVTVSSSGAVNHKKGQRTRSRNTDTFAHISTESLIRINNNSNYAFL